MRKKDDGISSLWPGTEWINRRNFLKIAGLCLLAAGCNDMSQTGGNAVRSTVATGKIFRPLKIRAVTDTTNWVKRDGTRVNLFDYPFLDGLTNYVKWSEFESFEGEFNWNGLERLLREADAAGKTLSYNILSGVHAPEWLLNRIPCIELSPCDGKPGSRTYLPWAEASGERVLNYEFLDIWENTVARYAGFLNSHPLKKRISYIAITGGPTSNGLEIMWPENKSAPALTWDARAEELFIGFWKEIIDIFLKQFHDSTLGLAFTDLFALSDACKAERRVDISKEIVGYALTRAKETGNTVVPMGLWFGNIPHTFMKAHPLVKLLESFDTPFAVQGDVFTRDIESLTGMLDVARDIGPSWIELWHNDLVNPYFHDTIMEMSQTAESTSWS
jgi:hypothetical protein